MILLENLRRNELCSLFIADIFDKFLLLFRGCPLLIQYRGICVQMLLRRSGLVQKIAPFLGCICHARSNATLHISNRHYQNNTHGRRFCRRHPKARGGPQISVASTSVVSVIPNKNSTSAYMDSTKRRRPRTRSVLWSHPGSLRLLDLALLDPLFGLLRKLRIVLGARETKRQTNQAAQAGSRS